MIDAILDTGPLVGALDCDDQWHSRSAKQFAAIRQLALTCDAVISEACFLLRGTPDSRGKIFALVERGIVCVVPILPDEWGSERRSFQLAPTMPGKSVTGSGAGYLAQNEIG